jgi:hypothetical protein
LTGTPRNLYPEVLMPFTTLLAHRHHHHRHPGGPAMLRALTTN